jgi:hypothetical protein
VKGAVHGRSGDLSISSRGRLTRRWRRLRHAEALKFLTVAVASVAISSLFGKQTRSCACSSIPYKVVKDSAGTAEHYASSCVHTGKAGRDAATLGRSESPMHRAIATKE